MKNIGFRAKERREELRLSQTEVGRACGVTQQAIEKLEAGEVNRPRYLDELATILKTTKLWLKDGIGQKGVIYPEKEDFLIEKMTAGRLILFVQDNFARLEEKEQEMVRGALLPLLNEDYTKKNESPAYKRTQPR